MSSNEKTTWISRIARSGLIAKGLVYVLMGVLAFMAAFELGGQSGKEVNQKEVFTSVKDWPGGMLILGLLAAGLVCYSGWRAIQTFSDKQNGEKIKLVKKIRYFFSGLAYLLLAVTALSILLDRQGSKGDKNQHWAAELISQPFGQWLLGIAALAIAAIGIYQIYYGLSEKFKKHVEGMESNSTTSSVLLKAGKTGYVARGVVWLIISYMLFNAAMHSNPKEAGDTGKAFQFVEGALGSYLLGALGIGLLAYGIFNFVRARYERFK
jgi:hypothetical protein